MDADTRSRAITERWRASGRSRPPATAADIAAFEATVGARVPAELRAVLLESNGTSRMGDEDFIDFLAVSEYTVEEWACPPSLGPQRVVVFADYLVGTYVFAFRVASDGSAADVWCGPFEEASDEGNGAAEPTVARAIEVAEDVAEFLRLYHAGSQRLHL